MNNPAGKKTLAIALLVLLSVLLPAGCGTADRSGDGVKFHKPSDLSGYDFLRSLGDEDVYICNIGEAAVSALEVPAVYKNKPVAAVIGNAIAGNGTVTALKIAEGVKYLEHIEGFTALQTVELPASVVSLNRAFFNCPALKEITLKGDVETISRGSFNRCTALEKATFLGNVGTIENSFSGCTALRTLDFRKSLGALKNLAFYDCPLLTDVRLPEGAEVEESVFSSKTGGGTEDGLRFVKAENLAGEFKAYIEDKNAYVCDIGSVTAAEAQVPAVYNDTPVTAVISMARKPNETLTVLKIAEGVRSVVLIENFTALRTVELPASASVFYNAFSGCPALQSITLRGEGTVLAGDSFRNCASLETVTFTGSVEALQNHALSDCPALKTVDLPASVGALKDRVLNGCPSLTALTLPKNVKIDDTVLAKPDYEPGLLPDEVRAYSGRFNGEALKAAVKDVLGQPLDPALQVDAEGLKSLADRFNGPILATALCPDCEYTAYSPQAVPPAQSLEVIDVGRIEYNYAGTVYTPEKAGRTPAVFCLVEYTGYETGPNYTGGRPADYLRVRLSLWDADSGAPVAWYEARFGYAPGSYVVGVGAVPISYRLSVGGGETHSIFLEKDGREPTPLYIVMSSVFGVSIPSKTVDIVWR